MNFIVVKLNLFQKNHYYIIFNPYNSFSRQSGTAQMRSNDENEEKKEDMAEEPTSARLLGKVQKGGKKIHKSYVQNVYDNDLNYVSYDFGSEYGYAAQPSYQTYDDSYSAPSYPSYGKSRIRF